MKKASWIKFEEGCGDHLFVAVGVTLVELHQHVEVRGAHQLGERDIVELKAAFHLGRRGGAKKEEERRACPKAGPHLPEKKSRRENTAMGAMLNLLLGQYKTRSFQTDFNLGFEQNL